MRVGFPCPARGRVLLIALPVVLLIGGGAAYFYFLRPSLPKPPSPEVTYEYELTDLTVNLADQDRPHYLRASVSLVIAGPQPEGSVEQFQGQMRDAVIMAVTQHTYQDLLSAEGKAALKDDIEAAVESVLSDEGVTVSEVLFTNFLMD